MEQKLKIVILTVCSTLALVGWLSATVSLTSLQIACSIQLASALIALSAITYSAVKTLLNRIFGIDALAAVAITASIASGQYLPATVVALMLFGGEILENYAEQRATQAVQKLIEAQPQTAIIIKDGQELQTTPESVHVGDTVLIKPGAKIPVDGIIQKGHASINQASVTGESMPVERGEGENVYSGTIVQQGAIYISVTAVSDQSTYGRIITMVKEAERKRAPIERTADRYARYFTPALTVLGLIIFVYTQDLLRVAAVFIIACPCALTLATPTALVAGMGNAARRGIIIRGGEYLEKLAKIDTLLLDKTGTITRGTPEVADIQSFSDHPASEILQLAAVAEKCSEHPLAKAILERAQQEHLVLADPQCFEHHPGLGVHVENAADSITVGNNRLLAHYQIPLSHQAQDYLLMQQPTKTVVFVAVDQTVVGALSLADIPRPDVRSILKEVKQIGIQKTVMLTGDNEHVANAVAEDAGIDEVAYNLTPADKVQQIQSLKNHHHLVAMVGDGINDAPALAASDVGIAMGLTGTDIAVETAGVTLSTDDLTRIPKLLRISKKTLKVVKQNIAFAMTVNVIGIILSTQGFVPPMVAAIVHESSALIVMLNAIGLLKAN